MFLGAGIAQSSLLIVFLGAADQEALFVFWVCGEAMLELTSILY